LCFFALSAEYPGAAHNRPSLFTLTSNLRTSVYASKGGKSFICLVSTYDKRGEMRSRIVTNLTNGNIVTTPRTDVMYVVTEFGIVNLKGKSVGERAKALISIAHPNFRESLERDAYEHRLIPRGFF